jgi:Outer membrane protein beta-barrel domain
MKTALPALAALVALATAAPLGAAHAQIPVLSAAAGLAVPTGRFSRPLDIGFNFQASAEIRPVPGPFEVRGDVLWSRFPVSDPGAGSANVVGGTLDLVLDVPTPGIAPYVLAGVGVYNVEVGHDDVHHSRFGAGLNVGGGARFPILPFLHGFFEMRYHAVYASPFGGDATFLPILVGVRLR